MLCEKRVSPRLERCCQVKAAGPLGEAVVRKGYPWVGGATGCRRAVGCGRQEAESGGRVARGGAWVLGGGSGDLQEMKICKSVRRGELMWGDRSDGDWKEGVRVVQYMSNRRIIGYCEGVDGINGGKMLRSCLVFRKC